MAKKPEVTTPVVKEEKTVEAKTIVPAKAAESKRVAAPAKAEVKESVAAVKVTAPKTVKKATTKTKKAKKEKVVMQPDVFIQYEDNGTQEAKVADIVAKVKSIYVAEGHRESSIKSLEIYMKPQEWAAYYVINNKMSGRIDLF